MVEFIFVKNNNLYIYTDTSFFFRLSGYGNYDFIIWKYYLYIYIYIYIYIYSIRPFFAIIVLSFLNYNLQYYFILVFIIVRFRLPIRPKCRLKETDMLCNIAYRNILKVNLILFLNSPSLLNVFSLLCSAAALMGPKWHQWQHFFPLAIWQTPPLLPTPYHSAWLSPRAWIQLLIVCSLSLGKGW